MTGMKQWPMAILGVSMLMAVLVLADALGASAQSGLPAGPAVTVINTDANAVPVRASDPLPVTGSVNLGGTPTVSLLPGATVDARQAGAWGVDIDRVRVPFQRAREFIVQTGFLEGAAEPFLVPDGHRLVIEQITALTFSDANNPNQRWRFLSVETTVDGQAAVHHVPFSFDGFNASVASHQVRLYADPGTQVTLRGGRNFQTLDFTVRATISGYLVALP